MKFLSLILVSSFLFPAAEGQNVASSAPVAASAPTAVPALVPFAATITGGKGETGMTFLLFQDQAGGEPLWTESQRVMVDATGHYAVQLGASSPTGLPLEVFASGTARWLEVQIAGQKPQPRVMMATVPYAAKAADAATLGGLPASAFALANPGLKGETQGTQADAAAGISSDTVSNVTTTGGTSGYVPLFNGTNTVVNSVIYNTGAQVGIGRVPTAGAILDVNGAMVMRGRMTVSRTGDATASQGYPSYGFDFFSNAYNSSKKTTANPYFELKSEPTGNNTSSPSATFNLLFANNGTIGETGFYVNPNGQVHFASGQTFPGAVTGVGLSAPSSDFTVSGSPITTSGTLSFNWTNPPTSSNAANSIVKRDSNGGIATGIVNASGISAGPVNAQSLTVFHSSFLDGPVTLNNNGAADADSLLLGNTSSKGLQLRDNGTGVDLESIGVGLNLNFVTEEPIYLNPNAGAVLIHDTTGVGAGDGTTLPALTVGANPNSSLNPYLGDEPYSAHFEGDILIDGGTYTSNVKVAVEHPLDPANKYLVHSPIVSSEALNQYSGNVTTDELGLATVQLPDWFEAENTDFRYQLTVIGRFAQAIVSKEIEQNQFTIHTNAPGVKVSWQVTAKRNDAYTRRHPLVVEQQKPVRARP